MGNGRPPRTSTPTAPQAGREETHTAKKRSEIAIKAGAVQRRGSPAASQFVRTINCVNAVNASSGRNFRQTPFALFVEALRVHTGQPHSPICAVN